MTIRERFAYVVDDDAAVRDSLVFLFEVDGIATRGFASVEAFLHDLPNLPHGCVVTDIEMPDRGGFELLRALQERSAGLPVIVMTGHSGLGAALQALVAGAFDFIEKPFRDATILQTVHAALGQQRAVPARAAGTAGGAVERLRARLAAGGTDAMPWFAAGY